jgi:hypothetical protein
MKGVEIAIFLVLISIVIALLIFLIIPSYSSYEKYKGGTGETSPPGQWTQGHKNRVHQIINVLFHDRLAGYLSAGHYQGMRYQDTIDVQLNKVVNCVVDELSKKFYSGDLENLRQIDMSSLEIGGKCGLETVKIIVYHISRFLQNCGGGLTCTWENQEKAAKCIAEGIAKDPANAGGVHLACRNKYCPFCSMVSEIPQKQLASWNLAYN